MCAQGAVRRRLRVQNRLSLVLKHGDDMNALIIGIGCVRLFFLGVLGTTAVLTSGMKRSPPPSPPPSTMEVVSTFADDCHVTIDAMVLCFLACALLSTRARCALLLLCYAIFVPFAVSLKKGVCPVPNYIWPPFVVACLVVPRFRSKWHRAARTE